jgi:hypothetical protein
MRGMTFQGGPKFEFFDAKWTDILEPQIERAGKIAADFVVR